MSDFVTHLIYKATAAMPLAGAKILFTLTWQNLKNEETNRLTQ